MTQDYSNNPQPQSPSSPPPSPPPKSGSNAKKLGLVVAGFSVLAVAGVGAFAYTKLASSGDYPYDKFASGAIVYVQTNTDPSANQKLAINDLAEKFPELKDEKGYKALTSENITGNLLKDAADGKGDFSWVGDRIGFAAYPDANDDGEPEAAILIEAKESANDDDVKILEDSLNEGADVKVSRVDVAGGDYVGFTTGDPEKYFETSDSLKDDEYFKDQIKDVQGNVIAAWADTGRLDEFDKTAANADFKVSGQYTFALEARSDGLDIRNKSYNTEFNGKEFNAPDNGSDVAELANSKGYENAILTLGFGGFGDIYKQLSEASDKFNIDDELRQLGINDGDLSKLVGDRGMISVALQDNAPNGYLTLEGASGDVWRNVLQSNGLTEEQAESELRMNLGSNVELELNEDSVELQMGRPAPESSLDLEDGFVTAQLDLDALYETVAGFFGGQSQLKGELGVVSLNANNTGDGEAESVLSWTTPR